MLISLHDFRPLHQPVLSSRRSPHCPVLAILGTIVSVAQSLQLQVAREAPPDVFQPWQVDRVPRFRTLSSKTIRRKQSGARLTTPATLAYLQLSIPHASSIPRR